MRLLSAAMQSFTVVWLLVVVVAVGWTAGYGPTEPNPSIPAVAASSMLVVGVLLALWLLISLPFASGGVSTLSQLKKDATDDADVASMAAFSGVATLWRPRLLFIGFGTGIPFLLGIVGAAHRLHPNLWWGAVIAAALVLRRRVGLLLIAAAILTLVARAMPTPAAHVPVWLIVLLGAATAASVGALGVIGLAAKLVGGRARYRSASGRPSVAVGNGIRRGSTVVAWLLLTAPLLVLDLVMIRGGGPSEEPFWRGVNVLSTGVVNHPFTTALALVAAPIVISIAVDRAATRISNVDAHELQLAYDVPTALYLRSWAADRIQLRARWMRLGILENVSPPRRMSLAEVIAIGAQWAAPLVATGEPGTSRMRGLGSMWSADTDWKQNVRRVAGAALCVIVTADEIVEGSGYAWEVDALGDGAAGGRLLVVLPPSMRVVDLRLPGGFLDRAADLPAFEPLRNTELPSQTLVLARSRDDAWRAWGSSSRTEMDYVFCIREAMDHFRFTWENELQPSQEGVSSERLVREATRLYGGNPAVKAIAWAVSRVIKTKIFDRTVKGLDAALEQHIRPEESVTEPRTPTMAFDDDVRRAVSAAEQLARARGAVEIGTDHVLLGLVADEDTLAVQALGRLGVTTTQLSDAVDATFPPGSSPTRGPLPVSTGTAQVLKRAAQRAGAAGSDCVGGLDLLIALADDHSGRARLVLSFLNVTQRALQEPR